MYNRIILIGRLVADPQLNQTQSSISYCRFTLAVKRNFKTQEQETDFIDIVTWRGLAENVAKFTRKGSLVGVEGSLQINKFENQEGQKVYKAQVVANDVRFLEPKKDKPTDTKESDPFAGVGKLVDLDERDLPF